MISTVSAAVRAHRRLSSSRWPLSARRDGRIRPSPPTTAVRALAEPQPDGDVDAVDEDCGPGETSEPRGHGRRSADPNASRARLNQVVGLGRGCGCRPRAQRAYDRSGRLRTTAKATGPLTKEPASAARFIMMAKEKIGGRPRS
jgi:hypothetical protein